MKNAKNFLLFAALLAVPATGSAQEPTHFSMGIGLAVPTHPAPRPGFGVGLAHQPRSEGVYPGPGAFAHGSSRAPWQGYRNGHHGYGHHGGWSPHDCWDYLWADPWFGCHRHIYSGYPSFGWWYPHPAWWWSLGYPGWSSPRYAGYHWFGFGLVWYGGRDWWYPRHSRGRYYRPDRYAHHGSHGGGYLTPRGYRPGGKAKSRGHSGDRIVRGSPLFGPRYKEDPRSNVTDRGRGRPVSRAVPRGSGASVGDVDGRRRPGKTSITRRPRPRGETKPVTTRSTPPKLRTRPGATPRTRATPTRRATPKAKAPTTRRPTSDARRAPSRKPAPKAKPATSKRSSPKARPAPARRPPPKASAPRRPASKAGSAPRRSKTSRKPPPRRGGKY